MKEALQQIVDLLQPVAALADGTPFEHSEVIQRCVDASEIALDALAQPAHITIERAKLEQVLEALGDLVLLNGVNNAKFFIKAALAQDEAILSRAAQQEPIGYAVPTFDFDNSVIKKVQYARTVPLYTSPPQRTWVGLTDEEFQYCVELKNSEAIAEEVEAKLKEKNI